MFTLIIGFLGLLGMLGTCYGVGRAVAEPGEDAFSAGFVTIVGGALGLFMVLLLSWALGTGIMILFS